MPTFQKLALGLTLAGAALHWGAAHAENGAREESAQKVTLAITARPLGEALNEWASQTGYQVLLSSKEEAGNRMSPALSGSFTPEAALQQLLANSGLKYEFVAARTVTILSASAPSSSTSSLDSAGEENVQSSLKLAQGNAAGSGSDPSGSSAGQGSDEQNSADSEEKSPGAALDQIIVTATKRSEDVMDVPISIAVIGNRDIERRGIVGMEDYLRSIPGVNAIEASANSNSIIIRGITTSAGGENFTVGSAVATYFDETPITGTNGFAQSGGVDVRAVDLERIEVLRGPQGTSFGSASLGGALRLIPAKPQFDRFTAKVAGAYSDTGGTGSDNSMVQGIFNLPVAEDTFALRLVGYRYEESGIYRNVPNDPATIALFQSYGLSDWVSNLSTLDDRGRMRSTGGRLAALWRVTDRLDISANVLTQETVQEGAPSATIGAFEQSFPPVALAARVRGNPEPLSDTDLNLASVVADYDLDWAELTSAVSWVDSGNISSVEFSRLINLPSSATYFSNFESFTAEARLASQFEGRLQFLGGVYYEQVEEDFKQPTVWPGPQGTNPLGNDPNTPFLGISTRGRTLDQTALFGEVAFDLTDALTATVGARYFEYQKDQSVLREGGFFGTPIGGAAPVNLESTESNTSLKANLSYEPTEDVLLYASWTEGFRLGRPETGVPPTSCDVDNNGLIDGTGLTVASTRSIDSDFTENYEIGGKFAVADRRLMIDTAVYHINWQGLPVAAVAPCAFTYFLNAGEATSDGVEFQARLMVTDGLRFDFGGGYTEAETSKASLSLGPEGTRLPGSPKVSANLGAEYEFNVAGRDAFVRVDSIYVGKFYTSLGENGMGVGDYIKVDARAGLAFDKLSVELFLRNLTNEQAFTTGSPTITTPFNGSMLRPRTVGMQLGYNF